MIEIKKWFVAEVWENPNQTDLLKKGIINYFSSKNQKLFFKHVNPFELLKLNHKVLANNFFNTFNKDILSDDYLTFRAAYGIKYLAEELLEKAPTAPLCFLYHNDEYTLTKGQKKIQSMSLINLQTHPSIIVSENEILDAYQILTDEVLYDILKFLNPAADRYYIRIELIDDIPKLHFVVDNDRISNWIDHKKCSEFYSNNRIPRPVTLGFLGQAFTNDSNIIPIYLDNSIDAMGDITIVHKINCKKYDNYYGTVYATVPKLITADYLEFASTNFYKESIISTGLSHTTEKFKDNELAFELNLSGIAGVIPYVQ